jgi:acyl-CoA thioester hydrolase
MDIYFKTVQIRWADIDSNNHLRHSVYYDYGVMVRMSFLKEQGITSAYMKLHNLGPVLFREEAIFKREILFEDIVHVHVEALTATPDFARWSLRHRFLKEDGTLAANLTIDGAWIDLEKRKLCVPTSEIQNAFRDFPKSSDFQWMEKK